MKILCSDPGMDYHLCAPPASPAAVVEAQRTTRTAMKTLTTLSGFLAMLSLTFAGTDSAPRASTTNAPTVVMIQLGEQWYIPEDLAQIVRTDAKRKKIRFDFEHSECRMSVRTMGSNDVVRVVYSKGLGLPAYTAFISTKGQVTTNYISTPKCGYGDKKMKSN